jgi:hypothetical protein
MDHGIQELVRGAVAVIEDVVDEKGWGHEDPRSMAEKVVAMAVESVTLAMPGKDRANLPIRIPCLRAWAQLAVVPAARAVAEDGASLVFPQERLDDLRRGGTGRWNGFAKPSDWNEREAWRERSDAPLPIPTDGQRKGVGGRWLARGKGH